MKGIKTLTFGALVGLSGLLANEEFKAFLIDNYGFTAAGLGTVIVVLRALTDSPMVGVKQANPKE